jgi:hypothetical protein
MNMRTLAFVNETGLLLQFRVPWFRNWHRAGRRSPYAEFAPRGLNSFRHPDDVGLNLGNAAPPSVTDANLGSGDRKRDPEIGIS